MPTYKIRAAGVFHDLFENATAGWLPIHGSWDNTSRWQCEFAWTFFSGLGPDSVVLLSKRRFDGDQSHEFYFGMKDIFGRDYQNRRYARRDVNFSFCCDGKDLFSGYTFLYGGFANKASFLYRGRRQVAVNDNVIFKPFDDHNAQNAIYDEHLYWHRLRFEKVGTRVRVLFENEVVFDYTDPEAGMPDGGHIAMWTRRNGIMYARLNSSAECIRLDAEKYVLEPPGREDLPWEALSLQTVRTEPMDDGLVRVVNRYGGGEFAVRHTLATPVDLSVTPYLQLALDIPAGVKVNLHLRVNGKYCIRALTAPMGETYRILGDTSVFPPRVWPEWRLYAALPMSGAELIGVPEKSLSGELKINLQEELRRCFPNTAGLKVEEMIIGNTSQQDYLQAGLSGNAAGATYVVGLPQFHSGTNTFGE
jgi:hypothetical protein